MNCYIIYIFPAKQQNRVSIRGQQEDFVNKSNKKACTVVRSSSEHVRQVSSSGDKISLAAGTCTDRLRPRTVGLGPGTRTELVCTVRSNASWAMVTWDPQPYPVDRMTHCQTEMTENIIFSQPCWWAVIIIHMSQCNQPKVPSS